jgi:3-phosphoshikimate 1-carboxyvinyltransferase
VTAIQVEPSGALRGTLEVPGDKSISHRALLLGALARGPSRVAGLLQSGDVRATADAVRACGVTIRDRGDSVLVTPPPGGLAEPDDVIDCGNSGTSMRLLAGVFASGTGHAVLTGDASLRRRPMGRVVEPLRVMGARIDGHAGGQRAPLSIRGTNLQMEEHDLPVASAQVKSALLLAGLRTGVAVREPRQSRDHTERMLTCMGVGLRRDTRGWLVLLPGGNLEPVDVVVPGDLSSAAFWLVAATVVPGSELRLSGVGVNPTRAGVIDALVAMGADIQYERTWTAGAEPVADIVVRHTGLHGTTIRGELALRCLDELPVLAVAAAFADGETTIADAAELRVKESDRIARVVAGLRELGVRVEERPDGMVIEGGKPWGPARVDAEGDHRLAMAFAVAGAAAPGGCTILHADAVRSSYPRFFHELDRCRRAS